MKVDHIIRLKSIQEIENTDFIAGIRAALQKQEIDKKKSPWDP